MWHKTTKWKTTLRGRAALPHIMTDDSQLICSLPSFSRKKVTTAFEAAPGKTGVRSHQLRLAARQPDAAHRRRLAAARPARSDPGLESDGAY
jgi:hypothetical protein